MRTVWYDSVRRTDPANAMTTRWPTYCNYIGRSWSVKWFLAGSVLHIPVNQSSHLIGWNGLTEAIGKLKEVANQKNIACQEQLYDVVV